MQGLFLQTFFLPSRLLSYSSTPGSWGDVLRAAFRHIRCQNHPLLRKIGWGAIYGAIDQVLWLPHSIPTSQDAYAAGSWRSRPTAVSHSNLRESQNKSIHSGPITWDYITQWILVECLIVLCKHTQVNPLGFGDIFLKWNQTNFALQRDRTLLIMRLTRSREPVGVPMLPGQKMRLPAFVIRVQLGYYFWGLTSYTTVEWQNIFFCIEWYLQI